MGSSARVFQLQGTCNDYSWGKKGSESLAARLYAKTPSGADGPEIQEDKFYSELWFGDYPDYPGKILKTGQTLQDAIQENSQELLGPQCVKKFGKQLPFLPKILSIGKALPLQLHPSLSVISELKQDHADLLSDNNHKPEIAIALSRFEAFVGWKPLDTVSALFNLPKLRQFIPDGIKQWDEKILREVVYRILSADEATIKQIGDDLKAVSRSDLEAIGNQQHILDLIPRLQEQYAASDPGWLVASLCMNYLVLEPGESIYIPANGIHAYLYGDIVECMARSNNMLSAGLAPPEERNRADIFAAALEITPELLGNDMRLEVQKSSFGSEGHSLLYKPPLSEFNILRVVLSGSEFENVQAFEGPAVGIVVTGHGTLGWEKEEQSVGEGYIFYVTPNTATLWRAKQDMEIHIAFVPN